MESGKTPLFSMFNVDSYEPDQHEDMMLKQNQISLTNLDFVVAQLF